MELKNQTSMTALVSAFSRAYHHSHSQERVYDDPLARQLLSPQEYHGIAAQMSKGVDFFVPGFTGTEEEALAAVVNRQLAPSPLGRAAFAQAYLEQAVSSGTEQYVILAAGYDTFAYRRPMWAKDLYIYEADRPAMLRDKANRLQRAGIPLGQKTRLVEADLAEADWQEKLIMAGLDVREKSFVSVLGLNYYLSEGEWSGMLVALGQMLPTGSSLVFDFPDDAAFTPRAGERAQKQTMLARAAGEPMRQGYSIKEMEALLRRAGFEPRLLLEPDEITRRYFSAHNRMEPGQPITAFDNVNYCLCFRNIP